MKALRAAVVITPALVALSLGVTLALADSSPSPVASSATITVTPITGPPSTVVTVAGSGFPAGEIVGLYVDAPGTYLGFPGPHADAQGNFTESDAMPGGKAGRHMICADTMAPSPQRVAAKACAPFTLVVPPSPTPAQSNGNASGLPLAIVFLLIGVLIGVGIGAAVWSRR